MKVYVEANFVLELALRQEQARSCEEILGMCGRQGLRLFIPAYSLAEPYETLVRRRRQRQRVMRDFEVEWKQLARTAAYADRAPDFEAVSALLINSAEQDATRLEHVRGEILGLGHVIPLERSVLAASTRYQRTHDFEPQDAIVYASVVSHLEGDTADERSCFINRDSKDFDDQRVVDELDRHRCKLLPRFDSGLDFLRAHLP